jgi:hypothetical protein
MSIFVSIASYCDPLLGFTVERALAAARRPDEIHFGIVDQSALPWRPPARASCVRIDPAQARGPCWARAIAMSFYRGEDWFLQLDSHMDFDDGWDERLAAQAQALAPGRKGVALTAYPSAFVFEDGKPVHKPITRKVLACVLIRGQQFQPGTWSLKFEAQAVETDQPLPGFHVGAGCLFATGRFALDFPYDPALYFHGEEQSMALRLFTAGWDIFHPPGMPIYHLYTRDVGDPRPMHWDAEHDDAREVKWRDLEARSQQRLGQLASGAPLGAYGLGNARTIAQFTVFSGIDYARRSVATQAYAPVGFRPAGFVAGMTLPTTTEPRGNWSG